jgi:hypothetical protein
MFERNSMCWRARHNAAMHRGLTNALQRQSSRLSRLLPNMSMVCLMVHAALQLVVPSQRR